MNFSIYKFYEQQMEIILAERIDVLNRRSLKLYVNNGIYNHNKSFCSSQHIKWCGECTYKFGARQLFFLRRGS